MLKEAAYSYGAEDAFYKFAISADKMLQASRAALPEGRMGLYNKLMSRLQPADVSGAVATAEKMQQELAARQAARGPAQKPSLTITPQPAQPVGAETRVARPRRGPENPAPQPGTGETGTFVRPQVGGSGVTNTLIRPQALQASPNPNVPW